MSNESENRIDLTQWKNEHKETLKECVAFSHENVIHERHVDVLIAELKRTYEEIDDLKRQYRSCYQSLIDTTDWNVRMQNAIDSGKMSEIRRVRNS